MSVVKSLLATSLAFGLVSLLGCSSSGPDETTPALSALSHSSDLKVTGDRNITFSVTATDNRSVTSVAIDFNSASQTVTQSGDVYSVTLALNDNIDNVIDIVATDSSGNITSQSIILDYPYFKFADGQPASVVIGQQDFDSGLRNQGGTADANTINRALGRHIVINGILYIADTFNNRILGYNTIPTGPNSVADFVIGQPDFTTTIPGIENNQLDLPVSIATDGTKFIVSLSGAANANNSINKGRVHIWNSIPISNVPADVVIGQPGFGQNATDTCTNNRILRGQDVFVVDGKMLVADSFQNRILIWDQIPTDSNQAANTVLGQVNFTNCEANDIDGSGDEVDPTASTFNKPFSIWSNGTKLLVTDFGNHRLLMWDDFPSQGDIAADRVLGQVDLKSEVLVAMGFSDVLFDPHYVTSNENQIFLSDVHGRILVWNSWPTVDNVPPEQVLGSDNFDTVNGVSTISQSTFSRANGIYLNENQLFVSDFADSNNSNRVLIFNAQ